MEQFQIKGNLWIEVSGLRIGRGRAMLLSNIKKHGSISKAAKAMEISYRQAWEMIASMNRGAKNKIVVNKIGGANGGGTILTNEGENLLKQFHLLEFEFQKFKLTASEKLNKKYNLSRL